MITPPPKPGLLVRTLDGTTGTVRVHPDKASKIFIETPAGKWLLLHVAELSLVEEPAP